MVTTVIVKKNNTNYSKISIESNVYSIIIRFNRYSFGTFVSYWLPDRRHKRKILIGQHVECTFYFKTLCHLNGIFHKYRRWWRAVRNPVVSREALDFLFQTNCPETGINRERSSYFFDFPTETMHHSLKQKGKKNFFFPNIFAYYIISPGLLPILLSVVRTRSSRWTITVAEYYERLFFGNNIHAERKSLRGK